MEQRIIDKSVTNVIKSGKLAIADFIRLAKYGNDKLFIDYDEGADVLYVSFGKPQKADNSVHGKDDIIQREKRGKIIGLTILNASRFSKMNKFLLRNKE